jgi:hypothetical protein
MIKANQDKQEIINSITRIHYSQYLNRYRVKDLTSLAVGIGRMEINIIMLKMQEI